MKLEQQVVSLELAKRLKELGVKQESYWYWYNGKGFELQPTLVHPSNPYKKVASAFSVAELGEMLPMHHNYGAPQSGKCNAGDQYCADYVHWYNLWHKQAEYKRYRLPSNEFVSNTEADARAKMLIYLIENKLITL